MEYLKDYGLSPQEQEIVIKASQKFHDMVKQYDKDPYSLTGHLQQLEKWGQYVIREYPELNPFVVFTSIWLHDAGYYPIGEEDHAITGERITRAFLSKEGVASEIIDQIAHAVRSHRNKDVSPATLEAKMIACIDSVSHFTDPLLYMSIITMPYPHKTPAESYKFLEGKMERDYRDAQFFPAIHKQIEPIYTAWKEIINQIRDFNF